MTKFGNTSISSFITTPVPVRTLRQPSSSVCSRRRRLVSMAASESGKGFGKPKADKKPAGLPVGRSAPTNKSENKADLGFVGNDRIGISFVCTANDCNTRVVKSCRRHSYERGTVIMQCPKCEKFHIIADHKNMYSQITGGKVNVEQIARAKGESVTRVNSDTFNLEDLMANFSAEDVDISTNSTPEEDPSADNHKNVDTP